MKRIIPSFVSFVAIVGIVLFAGISMPSFTISNPISTAEAASGSVVVGLKYYNNSLQVSATDFNTDPTPAWSGSIFSGYSENVPHGIYLNDSTFSVDFRIGLRACAAGNPCHEGWTPWASDIALGNVPGGVRWSPVVGAGPYTGGSFPGGCGFPQPPKATLHNRFASYQIAAQTRPLPVSGAGTIGVQAQLRAFEYDFDVPVDYPTCNQLTDAGIPGLTPFGGGWSGDVFDKWRNASTDGFVLSLVIGSGGITNYNAAPVSSNIPSTFSTGETKTVGIDGQPLNIVMKNTGTSPWVPDSMGPGIGPGTGTCQVDADGDGVLDAPAETPANYGAQCTVTHPFRSSSFTLSHSVGSFSPNPQPLQFTRNIPITTTYFPPSQSCYDQTPSTCAGGGGDLPPVDLPPVNFWNHGPSLISKTYAAACDPVPVCVDNPASYGYTYGIPFEIQTNDTATFYITSLTAPGTAGSYTEQWTMPFGTPFSQAITVNTANKTLTVSVSGTGTVTSNPTGINCTTGNGGTCSANFPSDSTVVLSQAPAGGSIFSGWGGDCSGAGGCSVVMSTNRSVSANFGAAPVGTLTVESKNSRTSAGVPASWAFTASDAGGAINTSAYTGSNISTASYSNVRTGTYNINVQNGSAGTNFAYRSIEKKTLATNWIEQVISVARAFVIGPAPSQPVIGNANTTFTILWDPIANMNVSQSAVSLNAFGGNPNPSSQVTVTNTGAPGSTLTWTSSVSNYTGGPTGWLAVSPTNGALANGVSGQASQNVTITATAAGLPNGTYTARVNLTGSSSPGCPPPALPGCPVTGATINVTLNVNNAPLGLSFVQPSPQPSNASITLSCSGGTGVGYNWSMPGAVPSSGTGATITISYPASGSYTITCTDGGDATKSISAPMTIYACNSFVATPQSVIPPNSSVLSWSCPNTTSCTLNGTSATSPNGTRTITPTANTSYTLSCNAGAGTTNVTRTTQVTVQGTGVKEINP